MTHVDWKPFPQNMPTRESNDVEFLLTFTDGNGHFYTSTGDWCEMIKDWDSLFHDEVVAYADMPRPYQADQFDLSKERIKGIIVDLESINDDIGAYRQQDLELNPELATGKYSNNSFMSYAEGKIKEAVNWLREAINERKS